MKIETHTLKELHAFRYTGENPKYALVISHGLGGHGGIYDVFCEHHAKKGADIWSYDAPGHGRSTPNRPRGKFTFDEWAQASRDFATHVKSTTGLPVFTLGSSLGAGAAIAARNSPSVTGSISMGSIAIPGNTVLADMTKPWQGSDIDQIIEQLGGGLVISLEKFFNFDEDYGYAGATAQKKLDPYNTWYYDLSSWLSLHRYVPPEALTDNTKPMLLTLGDQDPGAPIEVVQAIAAEIGGPVQVEIFSDAGHQLMLFENEQFSDVVHKFCLANI